MTVITFSASGEPRGKGRPRVFVQKGRAIATTDPKTRAYEQSVRRIAVEVMEGRQPFEGPLSLSLRFRLSPPVSMSKRQRDAVLAGEQPYFGRIDVDNCAKAIADALNGVCWRDDKQIVRLFATKVAHERPGVDVRVEAFT
jgi:Holliday junction resolvase RusA-like endonuclease